MEVTDEKIILLVEDNPDDVELTLRAFKRANMYNEVVVLNDVAVALDYFKGTGEHAGRDINKIPAVVLLDIKLPKVSGLEVLKHIRSNEATRLIPVVILTSSREEQDIITGYKLGANSYIRKPVDFVKFYDAVQKLGMYWLLLNEPPPIPPRRDS
jgi:two-component system response regulator